MPQVTGTLLTADDAPARGTVTFYLIGEGGKKLPQAYDQAADETFVGEKVVKLNTDGEYAVELRANADLIPANTKWARVAKVSGGDLRKPATQALLVPQGGGPYNEDDILSDPPGALAPAAYDALDARVVELETNGTGGGLTEPEAQELIDDSITALGLEPVATTGVYADLTGKPSIPDSADDIGAATPAQVATAVAAVDGFTVGYPRRLAFHKAGDWASQLATVDVTADTPAGWPTLTADAGVGVATGLATGGGDRRLHVLASPNNLTDVELYLDYESSSGGQAGLIAREGAGKAIAIWQNVFLSTSPMLLGVWEYNGTTLAQLNQSGTQSQGVVIAVVQAGGDGTNVTVETAVPHGLVPSAVVQLSGIGAFGQVTVASTPSPTVFRFTNATVGAWTGGQLTYVLGPTRRRVRARIVGNQVTWKQWLASEDEPLWTDSARVVTATLPGTLAGGGPLPTSGRVGFLIAHTGGSKVVKVYDWQVVDLAAAGAKQARIVAPMGSLTAELGDIRRLIGAMGRVGIVVKEQVGSVYAWPDGIAPPAGSYRSIFFKGALDPAVTTGGRDDPADFWLS